MEFDIKLFSTTKSRDIVRWYSILVHILYFIKK
jgi:hypothetical protein